jgi:hypothetical protein
MDEKNSPFEELRFLLSLKASFGFSVGSHHVPWSGPVSANGKRVDSKVG